MQQNCFRASKSIVLALNVAFIKTTYYSPYIQK